MPATRTRGPTRGSPGRMDRGCRASPAEGGQCSSTDPFAPVAIRRREAPPSIVAAEAVPAVEFETLRRQLRAAPAGQPRQHGVQRLLLGDAGLEGVLPPEARRD